MVVENRTIKVVAPEPGQDLSYADLSGCDLNGLDLRFVDFCSANLRSADLRNSRLKGADLTGADLSGAKLGYADLTNTRFIGCVLRETDFEMARLDRSEIGWCDLTRAVFTGVQARGLYSFDSCWSQVQAEGIDLRQSHLRACDFTEANLRGSDFSEACLWRCRFLRTDLRQSNAFAFSQISSAWLECLIESARWVGGVVADVGPNG